MLSPGAPPHGVPLQVPCWPLVLGACGAPSARPLGTARPSCPGTRPRCGPAREGPRICMRPAAREPRGRGLAGEGRRQGSPLPREPPLLRRRSLLPPPPPSRSLVLAGAAQTCSGAAAPAWICLGLRPGEPTTEAGGALLAVPSPLAVPGKGACPGRESSRGQRGAPQLAVRSGCEPCRLGSPALCSLPSYTPLRISLHPSASLPLLSPSSPVSSHLFCLFLLLPCSPFPFPALLPSPIALLSSPLLLLLSSCPLLFPSFSPLRPACLPGPLLPSGFFSLGSKRPVRCVRLLGGGEKEGRSYLTMGPFRRRERNGKGPLSSSFPAAPPYLYCSW